MSPNLAFPSFTHAASYASLLFRVTAHLFPGRRLFSLSPDERRMVEWETTYLLAEARRRVDSQPFAEYFGTPNGDGSSDGATTAPSHEFDDRPGQYV